MSASGWVIEIGSIGTFVSSALNNASAVAATWASVSAPMGSERYSGSATLFRIGVAE